MTRTELSKKSEYYIPAALYKQCEYFCRQYPDWVKELATAADPSAAIRYDREKVQTSGDYDSTAELAMRRHSIAVKKQMVDDAIAATVPKALREYVLIGVTRKVTVWWLISMGMPCGKNMYYKLRRAFFYELSRRI